MHMEGFRRASLLISSVVLSGAFTVAGCHQGAMHADEKDAVTNSLNSNQLSVVSVSQDRDKGVMTLTGNVDSEDKKAQAAVLAKQAAPDYTFANEIGVRPPEQANAGAVASDMDKAIEENFKAEIKGNKALDDQSIHASAKNGTLEVKGTVKTAAQKKEAGKLAKETPNVQQVVNEIEVNPKKHSTASDAETGH